MNTEAYLKEILGPNVQINVEKYKSTNINIGDQIQQPKPLKFLNPFAFLNNEFLKNPAVRHLIMERHKLS